jgi:hypothetical protein
MKRRVFITLFSCAAAGRWPAAHRARQKSRGSVTLAALPPRRAGSRRSGTDSETWATWKGKRSRWKPAGPRGALSGCPRAAAHASWPLRPRSPERQPRRHAAATLHSGRPAFRRASVYFAWCSGCRYGPNRFWRLEIRSAGSISSNRAINPFASSSRPASAQLAAPVRSAAWQSGCSRNAIFAHDSASSYRPAKK